MSKRSYKRYYDRYSCNQSIPKSTQHDREKRTQLPSSEIGKEKDICDDTVQRNEKIFKHHPFQSNFQTEEQFNNEETLYEDENINNVTFDDKLRSPICNCTNTNVGEVILMFVKLSAVYSFTWKALLDIFHALNCIFNTSVLPETKYMLQKLLKITTNSNTYHFLCDNCHNYVGQQTNLTDTIICTCGTAINTSTIGSFFIQLDIKSQLRKLFSDEKVVQNLTYPFDRKKLNENGLEDLYDGYVYQQYAKDSNLLQNNLNFSYTFNADGCQAADSSKISIWPIYIMLHQLPEEMRKKYMILACLWVGKREPNMNIYLQPFIQIANELSSQGFKWYWNGQCVVSKLFPLGCCVDSVARCTMLCMKKFNGKCGCTYCEHPTENIGGVRKYPMQSTVPIQRTDESIKRKMMLAHSTNNKDVTGVRGPSSLINLQHFDLVKGMTLDFLHACLLGVTQLYTTILLTNANTNYYIGSPEKLDLIDKRLLSFRPPSCVAKITRSIKERNMWKASEWLSWLIFYSLICFYKILKKKYFNNLAMFVKAMTILLQDSINPDMLEDARKLLITFVMHFEILYGKNYLHYNVHLLLHLCDTVKNWGPLYSVNTFPFENENKLLLQKKHCNFRIAQQIVTRLLTNQQIPYLKHSSFISTRIREWCDKVNKKRLKNFSKIDSCILIGKGKSYTLSQREADCVGKILDLSKIKECKKHSKIIYDKCRYTSCKYLKCKRRNDSVFQSKNDKYGIITNICKIKYDNTHSVIVFYKEIFIVNNHSINDTFPNQIKPISLCEENNLSVMYHSMLYRPV